MKVITNNALEVAREFLETEDSAVLITNRMAYGEFSLMVQNELLININEDNPKLENKFYFQLEETNLDVLTQTIVHYLEQEVKNFFIDDLDNTILTYEGFRDDILKLEKNGYSFTITDNNKLIK